MPNIIDSSGLQLKSLSEILNELLNGTDKYPGLYQIYGPNINVGPNSPDGQLLNLIAQVTIDVEELLAQVYASMDPDQAIGTVLDSRCAINGVVRRGATYTKQNILVTVNQAITLPGLDTSPLSPFTVSDSAGNKFQLITTYSFTGAGSTSLAFQAAELGPVQTTLNTITNIVTVTLGVVSVNNPTAATSVGLSEETDAALRIRRSNSVSLPSQGYLEGLVGALLDIDGVTQAPRVLENVTNAVDANGIPAHSIWCIVLGGTDADVARAIYVKRNAGCGMKGAVTVAQASVDGSPSISIQFDRPTDENLWINLDISAITGTVDDDYIRAQLLSALSYGIGQSADTTTIVALVKAIAPNASVTNEGVSNVDAGYAAVKAPTGVNYRFIPDTTRIKINGVVGT